ncbi:MAG TPA: hypothetical protein VGP92_07295 [Acidimicrobiia bacterium]|jgi:hypothetical protein|nr:hypothetical protein [Acidimicrobiia bacterium]
MHLNAVSDLIHARSFALGLAFGGVAFLAAAAVALLSRRRLPDIAGVAFVAAAWLAVRGAWGAGLASEAVAVALALLAAGGVVVSLLAKYVAAVERNQLVATALAVTPGSILLATATPLAGTNISRTVLALATIGIAVGMRDFDAVNGRRGAPWLLFAVAAGGVYLAVPDTELARVMLGVAVPFILLSVPSPLCSFGSAGSTALAGLFTWVVVVGGRGRPGSVVGGLAIIGILVAEPLGRRLVGGLWERTRREVHGRRTGPIDRNRDGWLAIAAVAATAQFVIALYASRVVGREDKALSALLIVAPMIAVAIFGAPELFPKTRRSRRRRTQSSRRRNSEYARR